MPDSNTPPRVTISVLGHVAVSQMGIVQVPYATVTVKYFRALIVVAYTVMAYTVMAHVVMAYMVVTLIVMAYVVTAYIVIAYIVIA